MQNIYKEKNNHLNMKRGWKIAIFLIILIITIYGGVQITKGIKESSSEFNTAGETNDCIEYDLFVKGTGQDANLKLRNACNSAIQKAEDDCKAQGSSNTMVCRSPCVKKDTICNLPVITKQIKLKPGNILIGQSHGHWAAGEWYCAAEVTGKVPCKKS